MTDQKRSSAKPAVAITAAAVFALAATIIKPWEGRPKTAYFDMVGVPTECWGHTGPDVRVGSVSSDARCERLLEGDMREAYAHVRRCITYPLATEQAAAFTSAAFALGPRVVCGSTLQRHANAGNMAQACGALFQWNKVKAGRDQKTGKQLYRVVAGLNNRRKVEYRVCMLPMVTT